MSDAARLPDYLARIGHDGPVRADLATLVAVHRAQRFTIPFENLDIPIGRGISLDPEQLFAKLVGKRRGGYCFEQNQLLLRMLHAIGFTARPLLARVWLMAAGVPPRTHTLNLVELGGDSIIADAGFGGAFVPPMRLGDAAHTSDGARHRITAHPDHGWMVERDAGQGAGQGWVQQYSFTTEKVWPADLEASNHWTAARPDTRFTTLRIVSRPDVAGFASLIGRTLTVTRGGTGAVRELASAADYRAVLADRFGLELDADEVAALGLF